MFRDRQSHFSAVLNCLNNERVDVASNNLACDTEENCIVSGTEIERCIAKLKNGKSNGMDNVSSEHLHTCQLSVIGTESPSFSSRQNLRPRRPKSPSFEHLLFSFLFFRFPAIISYFPVIIPISVVGKKQGWRLDEVGRHVQE